MFHELKKISLLHVSGPTFAHTILAFRLTAPTCSGWDCWVQLLVILAHFFLHIFAQPLGSITWSWQPPITPGAPPFLTSLACCNTSFSSLFFLVPHPLGILDVGVCPRAQAWACFLLYQTSHSLCQRCQHFNFWAGLRLTDLAVSNSMQYCIHSNPI